MKSWCRLLSQAVPVRALLAFTSHYSIPTATKKGNWQQSLPPNAEEGSCALTVTTQFWGKHHSPVSVDTGVLLLFSIAVIKHWPRHRIQLCTWAYGSRGLMGTMAASGRHSSRNKSWNWKYKVFTISERTEQGHSHSAATTGASIQMAETGGRLMQTATAGYYQK